MRGEARRCQGLTAGGARCRQWTTSPDGICGRHASLPAGPAGSSGPPPRAPGEDPLGWPAVLGANAHGVDRDGRRFTVPAGTPVRVEARAFGATSTHLIAVEDPAGGPRLTWRAPVDAVDESEPEPEPGSGLGIFDAHG